MSSYRVYVTPRALHEINQLPGHLRQRVRRAIDGFTINPRPPDSKVLTAPNLPAELWRQRIDRWRILYAISEHDGIVDVLAIRKRPPYDYGDLSGLLADL